MTRLTDNPENYDDVRWIVEQSSHALGDWKPIAVCRDRERASERMLTAAPPVRVALAEAEAVGVTDGDAICGAETANGDPCQNPAGSCGVPSHND